MTSRCALTLAALLLLAAGSAPASSIAPTGDAFAARLQQAMLEGAGAQDRLWAPGRTEQQRELSARTASLFRWTEVTVTAEGSHLRADGTRTVDVTVRGTATWAEAAWGVAQAFWTLQADEGRELNAVVRRERWTLNAEGLALSREPLSTVDVLEARLDVGVYPGQRALLVEGSLDVRARVDGVRAVRFLLDRRAYVYDFRVNGRMVNVVRGNELGSFGLEGFSPELESSFESPEPLAAGDRAVVRFRLRQPLIHMTREDGAVTSLPLRDGPFRERLWVPVVLPSGREPATAMEIVVHWPQDAFDRLALSAPDAASLEQRAENAALEERSVAFRWEGDVRDLDFALFPAGTSARLDGAGETGRAQDVLTFQRKDPPRDARTRDALIRPLLDSSYTTSRDLTNELQDLLPMDQDLLDELFDDSNTDAGRGGGERSPE